MKNSLRFVSAVIAAILCAAAFSACANGVKPPVTEVTTDITTDAPATIAPVTDVTTDAPITDAPETTVTFDAPITETTDISTTTDTTTEGAETSDTPATAPSTTAAPATDAPSVTTEATVTTTENVADPSEPTETLAKTIAEVLYLGDDGNVHVKGCDSFYLPTKGYYIGYKGHADRVFVVQNTPKGNLPEFYTKYVARLEEKYNSVSLRPTYHTDVNGNRISLNYVKHRYSTNGVSVSIATSDETDKQYVVTVFPNGNHNICESSIDFNIAEFYGDFGVIASVSGEMREESKIWITRDGGKTFEFFANRPIRDLHIMPCGYLYLFETDTKTAFYPGQESTVYHIYKIEDNALIEETPKIADKDLEYNTRGSYSFFSPIFDGNIGVWPVNIAYYDMDRQIDPGTHYLYFYLSTDYGETWERYDPAVVGIEGNTIIYRDCYALTTDTTTEAPVTTEVSVATEVPVSTQVAVTTDALVTTEVPVTTEPEQEEIIDTYGKSLAEILYKTDSGEVKIRGNSSFSLPCAGMYLVDRTRPDAPPTFVVKDSPKLDRGPRVYTSSNTKLYPEFRPDRYVDKDGNTIDLTYKNDEGTLAGMKCHSAISGDNYYIVTVFSDNTYNVSEIPGEFITIDYYNKDIGFLICKSNDAIFNAYCTYDGGKTFEFLSKLCKENRDYRNPQLYVTNTGMFYVTINPRLMGNSGSWEIVFEVEQGKIVKSDNVDLNSVYLRNGIEQNVYLLFDNNIGIWARYQSHYTSDRDPVPELHYIYYYISTDGGKTWQIYDPAIVGITIEETVYH